MNACEIDWGFYPSTSYQERNDHDLITDFESEVSMYLRNKEVTSVLLATANSSSSVYDNLANAYKALATVDIVKNQELNLVDQWLADVSNY